MMPMMKSWHDPILEDQISIFAYIISVDFSKLIIFTRVFFADVKSITVMLDSAVN